MMKQANKRHPIPQKHKKVTHPEDDSPALLAKHIGKSLLVTLAAAMLLNLVFSLIAYFYSDPDRLIRPLALAAAGLSALIGGFASLRIHGHAALLCGLLNGSAAMALMILASLFFTDYGTGYSAGISILLHAGFLLLSVAGAYMGLHKKPKKKKKY